MLGNAALADTFIAAHPMARVVLSPGGRRLVTGESDGAFRLWDVATGDYVAIATVPIPGTRRDVPFCGPLLASRDGSTLIWGILRGSEYQVCRLDLGALSSSSKFTLLPRLGSPAKTTPHAGRGTSGSH